MTEIEAEALGDLTTDEPTIVPWGERPAFVVLGHSEPMRVRPTVAEPVAFVERVIVANAALPTAEAPKPVTTMREKAAANGWSCRALWGVAEIVRRTLTPIEGSESKRYVEDLVEVTSVSLRLERDGHRAYAVWQRFADATAWTYVGGGLDGVHGLKITALRNALAGQFVATWPEPDFSADQGRPVGRYVAGQGFTTARAVLDQPTEPGQYRAASGHVYRVRLNASGQLYAERLVTDSRGRIGGYYERASLRQLRSGDRMTLEEAKALGIATGFCCVCGTWLTNTSSVEAGIGPDCAKRADLWGWQRERAAVRNALAES